MKFKKVIFLLTLAVGLYGCGENKDEYLDSLGKQNEISSQQQIQAERNEHERKAREMEKYLDERKVFIQALEGEFSGELNIDNNEFFISLEMIPSIPIEFYGRVRQLEEITYEIENLSLNLKVKMENPRVPNSASSCNIVNYKPDLSKGIINIISNECKNVFKFILSDTNETFELQQIYSEARDVSRQVIAGTIQTVEFLEGIFESSISSKKHTFKLERLR